MSTTTTPSPSLKSLRTPGGPESDLEEGGDDLGYAKRVRVEDFTVSNSRYKEEFVEIDELASGEFGMVKLARHRLDGIEYAIKISKKDLESSRYDEKMALNEVFAHAALMKHKHVVRYYNSWVESGKVFIQNEFCKGGSLSHKLKMLKKTDDRLAETELRKILVQILKGLQYIHNKQLVHLDIKPDNIFISHKDDDDDDNMAKVSYKIGDLGHVAQISAEFSSEEGDCRYMAPEFLQMTVDHTKLTKADVFSLGLTIYEAASLLALPKNSTVNEPGYSGTMYKDLREGKVPFLHNYSTSFNSLIKSMLTPDPGSRPDTNHLLAELRPRCSEHHEQDIIPRSQDTLENKHHFDDTLHEVCLTEVDRSKMDLMRANEEIFNLKKELSEKDVKISQLNNSFSNVESIKELSDAEKVKKYETLLRKVQQELLILRKN